MYIMSLRGLLEGTSVPTVLMEIVTAILVDVSVSPCHFGPAKTANGGAHPHLNHDPEGTLRMQYQLVYIPFISILHSAFGREHRPSVHVGRETVTRFT